MNEIVEQFASLESALAAKKGSFSLFALFLRDDVPDGWDLLVSAPWAGPDKQQTVDYLVGEIKSHLGPQALVNLSRIVLVDPTDPRLQTLNAAVRVEHGRVEVRDSSFFGLPISHAFIITSQRLDTPVGR